MRKSFFTLFILVLFISQTLFSQTQIQFQSFISGNVQRDPFSVPFYYGGTLAGKQTTDGGYVVCAAVTGTLTAGGNDVYLVKFDNSGNLSWTKTYGGTGDEYGRSVQQTADGYIIAGYTDSFGAGGNDVFLVKTDVSGNLQWVKTYGSTGNDQGTCVQQTSDNGYIITGFTSSTNIVASNGYSIYIIKTDAIGDTLWTRVYGSSYNNSGGYSIHQTRDGGYIVASFNSDYQETIYNNDDLLKIDPSGNMQWGYTYAFGYGSPGSVEQTADGGYILSVSPQYVLNTYVPAALFKTDSMGRCSWEQTYSWTQGDEFIRSSVQQTKDGGYILGTNVYEWFGNYDLTCLIKTDGFGNIIKYNFYGVDSNNTDTDPWVVQQTSDGGYMAVGYLYSDKALYLLKTDSNLDMPTCNVENYPITNTTSTITPIVYSPYMKIGGTVVGTPNVSVNSGGTIYPPICPASITITAASSLICKGSSTTLSANGAISYSWYPSTGLSANNVAVVTANPTITTTYTVTGTVLGETGTTVVTVMVGLPTVVVTSNSSICPGIGQTLSVTGANSYVWKPSASLTSSTAEIVIASPTITTTYTVIGTGSGGCTSMASTNVGVYALPTLSVSSNVTFCAGMTTVLSASGAVSLDYTWSPAASLNTSTGFMVTANPTTSTGYTLAATDANACTNTVTTFVNVNATPIADAGFPQEICQGNPASLSASGGGSYAWSPADYLNSDTGANVVASPTVFGTYGYTVTVTNINDCSAISTVTVTVVSALTANAGSDQSVCSGTTAMLVGTGGSAYAWNPAMGLSTTTGNTTIFSIPTPGVYSYTLTASSGFCSSMAGITVTVLNQPTIIASPAATVCLGNSTVLSAGGTGIVTIAWSPASGLSATMGSTVNAAPSISIAYVVIGTDDNGCSSSADVNVTVTVNPLPIVSITPNNIAICFGDSTTLTATGITTQPPITYQWIPSATLLPDTGTTVTANPLITTSYTVTGTDGNGCYNTAWTNVNVISVPVITISPANAVSICMGTSATLTANGATNYTWTPFTALNNTNTAMVTANPTTIITYIITGTTGACSAVDSVTISIYTLPTVVASADVSLCSGGSAQLSASGAIMYNWSPATSPTAGAAVTASPNTTTTYTVTGTDVNGCQGYDTVLVSVLIPAQVSTSPEVTIAAGSSTIVSASTGGRSYLWVPTDFLSCNTCQSITANPTATTVYTVTMIDNNGCSSSATVSVDVAFSCGTIFVPDVFSPNADNVNDVFFVYGAEHCIDPNSYTLQIFDRWGNRVFESFDPSQGWDGKYKGKELDEAVFVYELTATDSNNNILTKKGNITLIK